jgi:hypothetical protein
MHFASKSQYLWRHVAMARGFSPAARFFRVPCRWTDAAQEPMCFAFTTKERSMRPIIGVIAAAFAVLSLAGCSTTSSADNTTYARPPVSDGGMRVPLN